MNAMQALSILAVVALVTQFTRWVPFLLFGGKKTMPRAALYLGRVLPPAIIAILVVYCLRSADFLGPGHGGAELICVAVVAVVHLLKRNTLLSIGAGTFLYMALIRTLFA